jgi:hypothetical protein
VDVELEPEQPDAVVRAIAELLLPPQGQAPDPWWEAGIENDV